MAIRGVNLGGWLVLEKWITPSLFAGSSALDEYTFCSEGEVNLEKLRRHRDTYITEDDFKWLAANGIDAVRLPVGYWFLQGDGPFQPSVNYVDRAFEWAAKNKLKILLDLHGAPGSQNGQDHSGRAGKIGWMRYKNIKRTLEVVEELVARYRKEPALWAVELLNEPKPRFVLPLRFYYERGYEYAREYIADEIPIIIHDRFRPTKWNGFMDAPDFRNVALDCHLYQCFSEQDKSLDLEGHLAKTRVDWAALIKQIDKPVIVGEWSAAMASINDPASVRAYAQAQLEVFDKAYGWFFWTYKTESADSWNFRHLVESGLFVL